MIPVNQFKAIIFDIDGTLTNTGSWRTLTEQLGGDYTQVLELYNQVRDSKIDVQTAGRKLVHLMSKNKIHKSQIIKIYEQMGFKKGIRQLIKRLRPKFHLCLISGSTEMYVKTVAQKLNIKDWYALSSFEFDDQGYLNFVPYSMDQAGEKVKRMESFCQKYGYKPKELVAVGDSMNDYELFKAVGYSIFTPNEYSDTRLGRVATKTLLNIRKLV